MPRGPDIAFDFMRANYAVGMLDKTGALAGDALDAWMRETGQDLEDLLRGLDSASEETVARLDRLTRYADLFLRLGSQPAMLRLQSRLLDRPRVRKVLILMMKNLLRRAFPAPPAPAGDAWLEGEERA